MRSPEGHPEGDHDRIVYRFGDFVLDMSHQELSRCGTLVPLEPKVYGVLCYLVHHRDRQVSREELLE